MGSGQQRQGSSQLLAYIHACIESGRYAFHPHALERHPAKEGFNARQAIEAIFNGTIIENRELESECLISGRAPGVEPSAEYHGDYIHCSVAYDRILEVVIITMYRPRISRWIDHETRRHET